MLQPSSSASNIQIDALDRRPSLPSSSTPIMDTHARTASGTSVTATPVSSRLSRKSETRLSHKSGESNSSLTKQQNIFPRLLKKLNRADQSFVGNNSPNSASEEQTNTLRDCFRQSDFNYLIALSFR